MNYELESTFGPQFVRIGEMKDQFNEWSKMFYMEFGPTGSF
ncbi:MAG: hypothetical protein U0930_12515 [Pirellulales bacterium]